jgi:hypothetical protein
MKNRWRAKCLDLRSGWGDQGAGENLGAGFWFWGEVSATLLCAKNPFLHHLKAVPRVATAPAVRLRAL